MGEYVPPSQLPYNQRPDINQQKKAAAEAAARARKELVGKTAESQRQLPTMIRELFSRRADLITIVDFARPSQRSHYMPQGWFRKLIEPPNNETLIHVKLYTDTSSSKPFAYEGETISRMISVPGVHTYSYYTRGMNGYQDQEGVMRGYHTQTTAVLVTEQGVVRYPNDIGRSFDGREPERPSLVQDRERNCLVASLYAGEEHASNYRYAYNLAEGVTRLLNSQ